VIACIADLLKHDKAGDPMHGLKWTRKTTRKIAAELRRLGIRISAKTVGRLLGFLARKSQDAGIGKQEPATATSAQSAV
jgi:hypothetical protein